MAWSLPGLPDGRRLADLCREAAAREDVEPELVEKDFHLTRLVAALGLRLGGDLLLKGGTLLSKVDLGFLQMSEDADFVVPGEPSRFGRANAARLEPVRTALLALAPELGAAIRFPGGTRHEKNAHVVWMLDYASDLGRQEIKVEVSIRPVLRGSRRAPLRQLLHDPLIGDYAGAACHALSADEARAEKVRAAFTREEGRDYYDLDKLMEAGTDLSSAAFVELVDRKLAELGYAPVSLQGPTFGLDDRRRRSLVSSIRRDLPAVLRADAPPFDLDTMLRRFDGLWPCDRSRRGQRLVTRR
jgi:predicted nucleotidyltransferase component of viral defense system